MDRLAAIQRARRGEERGYRWLFREDRDAVFSFALRRGLGRMEADEVVQQVFVRAFRALPGLEDDRRYLGWFFQIARREVLREAGRRQGHAPEDWAADVACEREARLAEARQRERLIALLRETTDAIEPEAIRETARAYYFDGPMTTEELALQLGVPPATVRKRLSLFRRRLKARLAELFEEET